MSRILKSNVIILICLYLISCENPLEDRVDELEKELENQKIEQENQSLFMESLFSKLIQQQLVIDSLNKIQSQYADSLLNYSLNYTDSSYLNQLRILDSTNSKLTSYILGLIDNQNDLIETIISSQPSTGNNYIRIDYLQICWGDGSTDTNGETLDFPMPFSYPPSVVMSRQNSGYFKLFAVSNVTKLTASFKIGSDTKEKYSYIAIGMWE